MTTFGSMTQRAFTLYILRKALSLCI